MSKKGHAEAKIKLKRSQRFTKIGQLLYITCANYQNNNLWESASSCSFGFIFSFIPLALIIVAVLTGILKVSPGIYNWVMSIAEQVKYLVDITPFINNLLENKAIHYVDIFLGIWVIWMARKLFLSIIQAMTKIFRSVSTRKSIFNQAMIFFLEFLIVFIIAAVIIASFILNKVLSASVFENIRDFIPSFVSHVSHNLVTLTMYTIIFIGTVFVYRFVSGTKPRVIKCIFFAALAILSFFVFSIFLNKFMDLTNYNVIYGTISTFVILMMKVYFFFVFFLFFAQMIYVNQFFDILLQSEIYLLPPNKAKGWLNSIRRKMFLNPASLKTKSNTHKFTAGEIIYKKSDKSNKVYYIRTGSVCETRGKETLTYEAGSFFGDTQCILNQPHIGTAFAKTDCKLITFTDTEFKKLMQRSPMAATKAVTKISEDTAAFYIKNPPAEE